MVAVPISSNDSTIGAVYHFSQKQCACTVYLYNILGYN